MTMNSMQMTSKQGSMLTRRMHWKFDAVTDEQYKKLGELVLMSKLSIEDASLIIQALFDVETSSPLKHVDEWNVKLEQAKQKIHATLSKYDPVYP